MLPLLLTQPTAGGHTEARLSLGTRRVRRREKIALTVALMPSSVQRPCAGCRCSVTEAESGRREGEGGGGRGRAKGRGRQMMERENCGETVIDPGKGRRRKKRRRELRKALTDRAHRDVL